MTIAEQALSAIRVTSGRSLYAMAAIHYERTRRRSRLGGEGRRSLQQADRPLMALMQTGQLVANPAIGDKIDDRRRQVTL
jgi:hypothetical protein